MRVLPRRLNLRLILIICATLLASGAISGWATAKRQSGMLVGEMRGNSSVLMQNFSESVAYYLVLQDYAGLESFLLKSAALPNVMALAVCEADGNLLVDIERQAGETALARHTRGHLVPPASDARSIVVGGRDMTIWQPVVAGDITAWLEARFSLETIRVMEGDILRSNLLFATLLMAVSAVALLLVMRPSLRAFGELAEFARELDERKGDVVHVATGVGEIAELAISLNYASKRLLSSELQLVSDRQRLKESEEKYRYLLETVQEGVWVIDGESVTTFVNHRMAETLGYTREEMIGKPLFAFMDDRGRELAASNVERRKQGIGERHDFEFLRKDGGRIYARLETCPIIAKDGTYAGAIAAVDDVTETRRLEGEEREHLHFFECMDRINRIVQETDDIDGMLGEALDLMRSVFDCDRAYLALPCDPDAATWRMAFERHGAGPTTEEPVGNERPMDAETAKNLRLLLSSEGPVGFGPDNEHPLPSEPAARMGALSELSMALRPRLGEAWRLGIQQCSAPRRFTAHEGKLLSEIARRLENGLSISLAIRDLRDGREKLRALNEELERRVEERTAELGAKNAELERLNRLFVGRELRMVELKRKMGELAEKNGK